MPEVERRGGGLIGIVFYLRRYGYVLVKRTVCQWSVCENNSRQGSN